uniref:Ground-like domain-containing protein n=1 Tax=Strongyloides venezuelensis TaxID=75913 RepID=A0A0K0EYS3_STRVS
MSGIKSTSNELRLYPTIVDGTPSAPPPSYLEVSGQGNVNPAITPQYVYPQPPIIEVNSPCGDRYCSRGQIYIVDPHCSVNRNAHHVESEIRCARRRKRRIIMAIIIFSIIIIVAAVTTTIIVVNNQHSCSSIYDSDGFLNSDC